jgi:hypothetical protein
MSKRKQDAGSLTSLFMYGESDSEGADVGPGARGEQEDGAGGADSGGEEEEVDIMGALAAHAEGAEQGLQPQPADRPGEATGEVAAAAEAAPADGEGGAPLEPPRRQFVSVPAKFMEGLELPAAPEAPATAEAQARAAPGPSHRPGLDGGPALPPTPWLPLCWAAGQGGELHQPVRAHRDAPHVRAAQGQGVRGRGSPPGGCQSRRRRSAAAHRPAAPRYRNPDFLQKVVESVKIYEYGTRFAPEVFDPRNLHPEDFYDALCARALAAAPAPRSVLAWARPQNGGAPRRVQPSRSRGRTRPKRRSGRNGRRCGPRSWPLCTALLHALCADAATLLFRVCR